MNWKKIKQLLHENRYIIMTATILIGFAVVAAAFGLADFLTKPKTIAASEEEIVSLNAIMPQYAESGSDGNTVYAISVEDIGTVNTVKAFNYADDIFTETAGYAVNTGTGKTSSGTIKIIIKNLDPTDGNYEEKAAALDRFANGDQWEITLYIPAVFSACNIYVDDTLVERSGSIANYDYSYYSAKQLVTEEHDDATTPGCITVTLNNIREQLTGDLLTDACIVTIHYESTCAISGLMGDVLIGDETAVKAVVSSNSTVHFPIAAAGILVFALFIFICILKRTFNFLPQLALASGIFLYESACYALTVACNYPVATLCCMMIGLGIIALSAAFSCRLKIKWFDMRMPAIAIAAVCIVLGTITPFYVSSALFMTNRILYLILAAIVVAVQVINSLRKVSIVNTLSATATAVFLVCLTFNIDTINFLSPANWLCYLMLLLIMCIGFREFIKLEKASVNYTNNLKMEVEAQTKSLQTILDEKEDMLRFVSHDMHKPVKAMDSFLATLAARESDEENLKTIGILQSKSKELGRSLDELARYSKINYIAEEDEHIVCTEVMDRVYNMLSPDCNANGIVFNYTPVEIEIFAKRKSLESVLTNLIENAIEHSDCTTITLAAEKKKDKCAIIVTDDGNGIDDTTTLFMPYSNNGGEHGLGLYICKRYADSMNATFVIQRLNGNTIFTVSLPLA